MQVLEGEAGEGDHRLGDVALAGVALVDPVADVGALERTPLHGVQVDLAGERSVDEDAEAVPRAELALALAGAASHQERVPVPGGVGLAGDALGLPLGEPVDVALADLPPRREVVAPQGSQDDPPPDEGGHVVGPAAEPGAVTAPHGGAGGGSAGPA